MTPEPDAPDVSGAPDAPDIPDRRQVLSRALVGLAGAVEPTERARLLATAAQVVIGYGAVVVILTEGDPRTSAVEAATGSDDGCRRLAELERAGTGPAVGCARSGHPEEFAIAADGPPVDAWTRSAAALGWQLACALPLTTGGPVVGGLVLLSSVCDAPSPTQLGWARTLGGVAAAGLLQYRDLTRERTTSGQLREALESRIVIEQAKGVLAERGGVDPATAFARMRRYARTHRRRLHDVATDVVTGTVTDAVLAHVDPPADRAGGL